MATKITPKDFVEALKDWSILDVVEAVKAIEDEFGIKAATALLRWRPSPLYLQQVLAQSRWRSRRSSP